MDHDHFLTCSTSGIRKQCRLNLFKNLLQHLDTPPALITLLVYGLQSFCNSQLNNIHASDHKEINHQQKIGWDNFSRGRISKQFTVTMNVHYKHKQRTTTFTGISWTKQIINFTLSTHIDEWYHRCDSNSNPNQISFKQTFMFLENRSLLITIEFFYSRAEILPADQKNWFNSSIEDFKKIPRQMIKTMDSKYKKLFKINKKFHTYSSNKITGYFSKIGETTENKITSLHKRFQLLPLPNTNLPYTTVDNNIQKNNVVYLEKQHITNISSKTQYISKNKFENYNMSIPEYSSYSTITSSSENTSTIVNTKKGANNKYKVNNHFNSDSDSEKSKSNNIRRTKTSKKLTM